MPPQACLRRRASPSRHEMEPWIPGALLGRDGTLFRVWAPRAESLELLVEGERPTPMRRGPQGRFELHRSGVRVGARYQYRFADGRARPDPASRLQEGSIHGPSTVVDPGFDWSDRHWEGPELARMLFYELHVGTFTPQGTLASAQRRLPQLAELGVTAVELMPLSAFDGPRGWGYDGVQPWAVHQGYGGPKALQQFVDAAHALGLSVFLDVVYNHLGPSGSYQREFAPYFTDRHQTPWGDAVNFDGPQSQQVREYFVENALYWLRDYHLDGLRLDAVHGIIDASPVHVVRQIAERVERLSKEVKRRLVVIAESDLNEPKLVLPRDQGGWGVSAQWSDDFHHSLHTLLTGERTGYYQDFGALEDLAKAYRESFVMDGQLSRFRGRPHGASARGIPGRRFVVASQNHDQVGNRALGDRLSEKLDPAALKLAAAATLLSPFLPLLFMGEEWAEKAPFQYFTSFEDRQLGRAVSEGRRKEFAGFKWSGEVPDPQASETFERSRLDWSRRESPEGARMLGYYRRLIALRQQHPALSSDKSEDREVSLSGRTLLLQRRGRGREALLCLVFSAEGEKVALPEGRWRPVLDSWAPEHSGTTQFSLPALAISGSLCLGPWHAAMFERA